MSTDLYARRLCTAYIALVRLQSGHWCFISGQARFPSVQKEVLPELVVVAGFGELFVFRVAGNVLGPSRLDDATPLSDRKPGRISLIISDSR